VTIPRARAAEDAPKKRVDPKPRPIAPMSFARLENTDPGRRYIQVDKSAQIHGIEYWEDVGYRVETFTGEPGCLRFRRARNVRAGEPLEAYGQVVMSVEMARHEEIEKYGPDGVSGQKSVDDLERQIVKKRGGFDPLRGLHGGMTRALDFANDTEPLREVELNE
jgi:hypothetical protein